MVRRNAIYKNISQAIDEMMEDSKTEGIEKGKLEVLSNLLKKWNDQHSGCRRLYGSVCGGI